jgi:hypothetical protein
MAVSLGQCLFTQKRLPTSETDHSSQHRHRRHAILCSTMQEMESKYTVSRKLFNTFRASIDVIYGSESFQANKRLMYLNAYDHQLVFFYAGIMLFHM